MITSIANARIRALQRLAKRRRDRERSQTFLVEGRRELRRALAAGVHVETVVWAPEPADADAADLVAVARRYGADVIEVADHVLDSLVYRGSGVRVLGVARMFGTQLDRLELGEDALVLVAAGIEKPGNLGAMLRSAAAAGATAVVVADPSVDVFNPNVVRASLGALFTVPLGVGDAEEVAGWLRRHAVPILATTPAAAVPYWSADLDRSAAIVVGSEHEGLPPVWLDAADGRIVVPMSGDRGVDSLNAASTAAIVLFDAVRQRRTRSGSV